MGWKTKEETQTFEDYTCSGLKYTIRMRAVALQLHMPYLQAMCQTAEKSLRSRILACNMDTQILRIRPCWCWQIGKVGRMHRVASTIELEIQFDQIREGIELDVEVTASVPDFETP